MSNVFIPCRVEWDGKITITELRIIIIIIGTAVGHLNNNVEVRECDDLQCP